MKQEGFTLEDRVYGWVIHRRQSQGHQSYQEKILKIGGPIVISNIHKPFNVVVCYALNLQDDIGIPNMRRNIPKT